MPIRTAAAAELESKLWIGPWDRTLVGISLIDGSAPRSVSVQYCHPDKLSYREAVSIKVLHTQRREAMADIAKLCEHLPESRQVWK